MREHGEIEFLSDGLHNEYICAVAIEIGSVLFNGTISSTYKCSYYSIFTLEGELRGNGTGTGAGTKWKV